jgi:hypothetical protein
MSYPGQEVITQVYFLQTDEPAEFDTFYSDDAILAYIICALLRSRVVRLSQWQELSGWISSSAFEPL